MFRGNLGIRLGMKRRSGTRVFRLLAVRWRLILDVGENLMFFRTLVLYTASSNMGAFIESVGWEHCTNTRTNDFRISLSECRGTVCVCGWWWHLVGEVWV